MRGHVEVSLLSTELVEVNTSSAQIDSAELSMPPVEPDVTSADSLQLGHAGVATSEPKLVRIICVSKENGKWDYQKENSCSFRMGHAKAVVHSTEQVEVSTDYFPVDSIELNMSSPKLDG